MNMENNNRQLTEQQVVNMFQCLTRAEQRAMLTELQEKIHGTEQSTATVATVGG